MNYGLRMVVRTGTTTGWVVCVVGGRREGDPSGEGRRDGNDPESMREPTPCPLEVSRPVSSTLGSDTLRWGGGRGRVDGRDLESKGRPFTPPRGSLRVSGYET